MADLAWTDLAVAVLVVVTSVLGAFRGAVRLVVSLVALLLGVAVAAHVAPGLHAERLPWMDQARDPLTMGLAVSWCLILLVALMFGSLVGRLASQAVEQIHFGAIDRVLGLALGVAKGAVYGAVLCVVLLTLPDSDEVRADAAESQAARGTRWMVERASAAFPDATLQPLRTVLDGQERTPGS
ncbi:MAG: CvpA family protein [Planctomycetota bacterium]|jgi:membrane protein required for colicin V production